MRQHETGGFTSEAARRSTLSELLTVAFPIHGDLTIDPAVNFVRKHAEQPEDDDLL